MDYFYCSPDKIVKDSALIDGEEFAHLVHVMRKKEGDEIRVVDGLGTAYDVRLADVKNKRALGLITTTQQHHHEPSTAVTLAVAILKNPSKYDFLVEKVTELGVREIVPLKTERTIPDHAKVDRWQKLALAAMKQTGRAYLPQVRELISLDGLLAAERPFDLKVIAHQEGKGLTRYEKTFLPRYKSTIVLIGPEGGFSDDEVRRCVAAGYIPVSLGERRLRTETAAIVMSALAILSQIEP